MPIIQELIRDDYSFEQAEEIQIKYHNLIKDSAKGTNITNIETVKTVAGLDVSYFKEKNCEYGIACAVIWNLKEKIEENHFFIRNRIRFPYKPGFLGFRECKILARLVSSLPNKPDLIMCDGHGKVHPKRFGEATHLGYALDIPSIGIAKSPFIGFSDWQKIKKIRGKKASIWGKDPNSILDQHLNELLGLAVCLKDGSKPIFISVGYKISLNLALKICLETSMGHKQPEPLYLADFLSRKEVKNLN